MKKLGYSIAVAGLAVGLTACGTTTSTPKACTDAISDARDIGSTVADALGSAQDVIDAQADAIVSAADAIDYPGGVTDGDVAYIESLTADIETASEDLDSYAADLDAQVDSFNKNADKCEASA